MKYLTTDEANKYLACIEMKIGEWNQITHSNQTSPKNWINYSAPNNAHELLNFSHHIAGWLPKGEWKIFQIDNSTCLDDVQKNFIGTLLFGSKNWKNLDGIRTILFEFGNDLNEDQNTELLLSNLIHAFLLYECHGYFVSSNSRDRECLAIQDGVAYFSTKNKDINDAKSLLKKFEQDTLKSPQWIIEIIGNN